MLWIHEAENCCQCVLLQYFLLLEKRRAPALGRDLQRLPVHLDARIHVEGPRVLGLFDLLPNLQAPGSGRPADVVYMSRSIDLL